MREFSLLFQSGLRVKRSAHGWGCQVTCPVGPPGPPGPKGNKGPASTGWGGEGPPGMHNALFKSEIKLK